MSFRLLNCCLLSHSTLSEHQPGPACWMMDNSLLWCCSWYQGWPNLREQSTQKNVLSFSILEIIFQYIYFHKYSWINIMIQMYEIGKVSCCIQHCEILPASTIPCCTSIYQLSITSPQNFIFKAELFISSVNTRR